MERGRYRQTVAGPVAAAVRELIPSAAVPRTLALTTLVQALGAALFLACGTIFLHRVAGFSAADIGLGLSVAGFAGFAATVPIGRWADRVGARRLLAADYVLLAVLFALYGFVDDRTAFIVLAAGIAVGETSLSPLRAALTYAVVEPGEAVTARAQMRTSYNIGFAAGGALAALALAAGGRTAFITVGCAAAVAHLACAVLTARLRDQPHATAHDPRHDPRPTAAERGRRGLSRTALRDGRFVAVTLLNGALELHGPLLTVGLPLWIVDRMHAPASINSALLACNTILVVLFQVPLSRGSRDLAGAARTQLRGALLVAVSCLVFLAGTGAGTVPGCALLLAGVAVLSFGEILQSAGGWTISFELPPPGQQAEYQAVFALGRGLRQFTGPAVVTFAVVGLGPPGWALLAAAFAVLGALAAVLVSPRRSAPRKPSWKEPAENAH